MKHENENVFLQRSLVKKRKEFFDPIVSNDNYNIVLHVVLCDLFS